MGKTQVNKMLEQRREARKKQNRHGLLVAEGDSWFDYPEGDLLDQLRVKGYEIRSVAKKGDTIERMAYRIKQAEDFCDLLLKVDSDGHTPTAILLSGGGNDLSGDRLALLLEPKKPGAPATLDSTIVARVMKRISDAYVELIGRVTEVCSKTFPPAAGRDQRIPIIIHGYAYPVPDGRGFGGWFFLPGPWLRPSLEAQGHFDADTACRLVKNLIDRLHVELKEIEVQFGHVHHLDIRTSLQGTVGGDDYKERWANEMHPTRTGFAIVADAFHSKIQKLVQSAGVGGEAGPSPGRAM